MYVFQLPLIRVLDPVLTPEGLSLQLASIFWGRVTYIALMIAITTLFGLVSWSLYEKHFLALKSRFETTTREARLIPANRGSAQAAP